MARRAAAPSIEQELPPLAQDVARVADAALTEDAGRDVTTEVVGIALPSVRARVATRETCVIAGLPYAAALAERAGARAAWSVEDGARLEAGAALGAVSGSFAAIMRAERAMLNLLQRAAGIATRTRAFVDAVQGTGCRILHTRKTVPGLRGFDVRAVLAGGGTMNRGSLGRTVMVKDNHWRALEAEGRDVAAVVTRAHERGLFCIVEVESTVQVEAAARAGADRLLIDNQPPTVVRDWAWSAKALAPQIEIEASGGLTLESVRRYAEAADFVSIGALTHSAAAVDLTLDVDLKPDAPGVRQV